MIYLRYLTAAFDNIRDAVVLVGIEQGNVYRLLVANKSFHDISGYPPDCIGKEVGEFASPDGFDYLTGRYKKVRERKRPVEYIRWSNVPAGRRAFEVQLIPITNTVDEVVQIIGIVRDVTTLLKLKNEVQELRALLAAR